MNSRNYFLMLALSSFISGCIGGGGGGSSSAVVASTTSFLDSGTSLTYNSTNASTLAASREFQNFNYIFNHAFLALVSYDKFLWS